jgi:hypothetical protein
MGPVEEMLWFAQRLRRREAGSIPALGVQIKKREIGLNLIRSPTLIV